MKQIEVSIKFLHEMLFETVQWKMPCYQRKYSWGKKEIEDFLSAIREASEMTDGQAKFISHIVTQEKPEVPARIIPCLIIGDGNQRITTSHIFLECFAKKLDLLREEERQNSPMKINAKIIRGVMLSNDKDLGTDLACKLIMDKHDKQEYDACVSAGKGVAIAKEMGNIAKAWKQVNTFVKKKSCMYLWKGFSNLLVSHYKASEGVDLQEIFASLNTTGMELKESEKTKNWLLQEPPGKKQQDHCITKWHQMEENLGATRKAQPVDDFLKHFVLWKTGDTKKTKGGNYNKLCAWAKGTKGKEDYDQNKDILCDFLEEMSGLYKILTSKGGGHKNDSVAREIRSLNNIGITTHRPLTLRLLHDEKRDKLSTSDLIDIFKMIRVWITRLCVAGKKTNPLTTAFTKYAVLPGPNHGESHEEYWRNAINDHTKKGRDIAMPSDDEVRRGIEAWNAGISHKEKALGIFCYIMEAEQGQESPSREHLSIEHVMPKTLTEEWKEYLGPDAEEIHGKWVHTMANLTLSGNKNNAKMGVNIFKVKRENYEESSINLTKDLANYQVWDEKALKHRSEYFVKKFLHHFPWEF